MSSNSIQRRKLSIALLGSAFTLTACKTNEAIKSLEKSGLLKSGGALSITEITAGLKEALSKGSSAVVSQLGANNGFNTDSAIRIPLPTALDKARKYAAKVGLDKSFNELETKLNHAAERATPKAKSLFLGAIRDMSVQDAKGILRGPDNAATKYFEEKTRTNLAGAMRPLVDQSLSEVGAVNYFNQLMGRYKAIPFAPKVDADLTTHVVDKGMDGIFFYLAKEEKAIRENPVKRTSELLRRVFG